MPERSNRLRQLVEAGIVERTRDDVDRRVFRNRMTRRGKTLYRRRTAEYDAKFEQALAGLDAEDLRRGAVVLERLRSFFEAL